MNRPLLLSLLFAPLSALAQTYYYVDNISVAPIAPTTSDPVTVTLIGNLGATNHFIVPPTSVNVVGFNVNITVNAGTSGIGSPTLTPHNEFFSLGTLPAGTYTINITGMFTGDFAPAPEHQFVVSGGGNLPACDSLIVAEVLWDAFSDTLIEIHVFNNSSVLFDYPGWIMFNSLGDTLAMETVNFFGISQESWHTLVVRPGAVIPTGTFTATFELWTGFYVDLACTFTWTGDLCPPACRSIFPFMQNTGGGLVTANIGWTMLAEPGGSVGSGTFELGAEQYSEDSLCLVPGRYTLVVDHPVPLGGNLQFGVHTPNFFSFGASAPFTQDMIPDSLTFDFYPACFELTNGVVELPEPSGLIATALNGVLHIAATDELPIGGIALLDMSGRRVIATLCSSSTLDLDVASLADGVYLLHAVDRSAAKRVVVQR